MTTSDMPSLTVANLWMGNTSNVAAGVTLRFGDGGNAELVTLTEAVSLARGEPAADARCVTTGASALPCRRRPSTAKRSRRSSLARSRRRNDEPSPVTPRAPRSGRSRDREPTAP